MRISSIESEEDIRSHTLSSTRDATLQSLTQHETHLSQRVHELNSKITQIQQQRQEAEEERMSVCDQMCYQQAKMDALVSDSCLDDVCATATYML